MYLLLFLLFLGVFWRGFSLCFLWQRDQKVRMKRIKKDFGVGDFFVLFVGLLIIKGGGKRKRKRKRGEKA
jgi:hypothetical protein